MKIMNFLKKNYQKLVLSIFVLFTPFMFIYADSSNPCNGKICDPLGGKYASIPDFIQNVLTGVLKIGIPLVALAIIYSGFLFVEARGNSEKLTKAKDSLMYTLIGAAILLGSWAIAQMIQATVLSL